MNFGYFGRMSNLTLYNTVVNGGNADKEVERYSEIVQLFDDRSLSLVIRTEQNITEKYIFAYIKITKNK